MAVIVEGGGYGSRSAAPIAAALVLKARDLGYFKGVAPQLPAKKSTAKLKTENNNVHPQIALITQTSF